MLLGEFIIKIINIPSLYADRWYNAFVYIKDDSSLDIVWCDRKHSDDGSWNYHIFNVLFKKEPKEISKMKKEFLIKGVLE